MNGRHYTRSPFGGGGGFESPFGPAPRDFYVLVGVLFAVFSLRWLGPGVVVANLLSLTPLVWQRGFLWQVVTYPFAGYGAPSLWILLELLILYWFGRTVRYQLGRKRFWRTLLMVGTLAGVVAVLVQLLEIVVTGTRLPPFALNQPILQEFALMEGQRMVLAIIIAAFATLNAEATILLFFILPVKARMFLWIEIVFAFVAFLGSDDFAGFVGITVAVGATYGFIRYGSPWKMARRWWLRLRDKQLRAQLDRERKKRKFRVVKDDEGPTVH